jgi:aspartate carbamoyltransferase catalytic subunit
VEITKQNKKTKKKTINTWVYVISVGYLNKTPNKTNFKNLINISDFSRQQIEFVLEESKKMKELSKKEKSKLIKNKVVASLFFEPSTRTRLSFETAIQNLGGRVIGFADASVSSAKKGESLSDTISTVEKYADCIVMRHFIEGATKRASEVTNKPIINAGDGSNQHPTQTLLDLFTINEQFGKIDELNIALLGDLKYGRTVHSLAEALNKFNNIKLYLISPPQLEFPTELLQKLNNIKFVQKNELDCLEELDVLYVTRIQKERFPDEEEYEKVKNAFIIGEEILEKTKDTFRVMHPLPRVNEISTSLDKHKKAIYFKQAENGLYVREALLNYFLGESK